MEDHQRRYLALAREKDALEGRLAQMHHTQSLSAQTILALRRDLSDRKPEAVGDTARVAFLEQVNRQLEVRVAGLEGELGEVRGEVMRWREMRVEEVLGLGGRVGERVAAILEQLRAKRDSLPERGEKKPERSEKKDSPERSEHQPERSEKKDSLSPERSEHQPERSEKKDSPERSEQQPERSEKKDSPERSENQPERSEKKDSLSPERSEHQPERSEKKESLSPERSEHQPERSEKKESLSPERSEKKDSLSPERSENQARATREDALPEHSENTQRSDSPEQSENHGRATREDLPERRENQARAQRGEPPIEQSEHQAPSHHSENHIRATRGEPPIEQSEHQAPSHHSENHIRATRGEPPIEQSEHQAPSHHSENQTRATRETLDSPARSDNTTRSTLDLETTQHTLAQLVADNTLLRHDNAQLSLVLAELRHGTRHTRTVSRTSTQRHSISDTPSRPDVYPRPLTLSISSTTTSAPSHSRHQSLTPSLGNPPPPYTHHTRTDSYTPVLASPRTTQEDKRPLGRRTCSIDRPSLVNRGGTGVSSIAESSLGEEDAAPTHERDFSHSSTSSNPTSRRVKRLSLTPSFRPPVSPLSNDGYFPPLPTGNLVSPIATTQRRPLKLLSNSIGVQTDPIDHSTPTVHKATLAGLGFEETSTTASSTHSTPLFLSPYSPFPPTPNPELSTFPPDSRTTSLLVLVEHMSKILARVRQADVPTLTRRLKKQHLPGDVGHLSSSTLKSLTEQVADMRTYFRRVLDDEKRHPHDSTTTESLVTRKDFMLLIKLFKEMFTELVQLRTVVNQIILDPFAVTRLKESVQAAIDMVDPADAGKTKHAKSAGLGWIAPISKLFTAAPTEPSTAPAAPTPRSAPKLEASTSASTTHVNVEFASTGIIRRSTHALPVISAAEADPYTSLEPISPDTHGKTTLSRTGGTIKAKPRPAITLGDGSTRGGPAPPTRAGLMSIFAGAPAPSSRPTIRPKASLEFHGTQRRLGSHRRRISNAVDAVIDQPLPENTAEDDNPTLLERQLRPRGLSDSSIRTTYQSHAVAAPVNPQPRPAAAGSYWPDSRSMVKTLGKRIQAFAGASDPASTPADPPTASHTGKREPGSPLSSSPAVPVGIKPSQPTGNALLGGSYNAMGKSYMDILTSTSLITDNAPHLTHSHHVADFER